MSQQAEEARRKSIPGWKDETSGRPQLPEESFGEFLDAKAERNRSKPYILFEDRVISYGQLREKTNRIANTLTALGLKKDDKVAVMMANSPEYVFCQFALSAIGAVFVPVNAALVGEGLAYILNQSDSKAIFLDRQLWDALAPVRQSLEHIEHIVIVPPNGESPAPPSGCLSLEEMYRASDASQYVRLEPGAMQRILYTSGTTGLPKGTVLRKPGPNDPPPAQRTEAEAKYSQRPEDIPYNILPLFHALGQADISTTLNLEGTLAMARRFSASRFWPDVRRYGCTRFYFAGSIVHILLKQPPQPNDREHKLRIGHGYAPIRNVKDEFERRFGVTLIENYGSSDYVRGRFLNLPGGKPGSIGKPDENGPLVKIVDEKGNECPPLQVGEIVSRPRDPRFPATVEYYRNPEASKAKTYDGWFHTGDYGYRDEEGWLFFSDRERQFIRRRGENISSLEIERIVDQHPDVEESAAVGVRAEFDGDQEVKVCVVLKPGSRLTAGQLLDFCEDRMAYYMVPRFVDLRDALPKTGTQRVQKYLLVDEGIAGVWDRQHTGHKLKRDRGSTHQ